VTDAHDELARDGTSVGHAAIDFNCQLSLISLISLVVCNEVTMIDTVGSCQIGIIRRLVQIQ
jgi:hypothetical protein